MLYNVLSYLRCSAETAKINLMVFQFMLYCVVEPKSSIELNRKLNKVNRHELRNLQQSIKLTSVGSHGTLLLRHGEDGRVFFLGGFCRSCVGVEWFEAVGCITKIPRAYDNMPMVVS